MMIDLSIFQFHLKVSTLQYTLQIICPIAEKKEDLSFSKNQEITVIGTAQNFTIKTNSKPNTLYMSNCFAKNS